MEREVEGSLSPATTPSNPCNFVEDVKGKESGEETLGLSGGGEGVEGITEGNGGGGEGKR